MKPKRKACITGGNRGIGAAIVRELSRRGFQVWSPARAELDLSDPASVTRFVKGHPPAVDVLVNNAGINHLKALPELDSTLEPDAAGQSDRPHAAYPVGGPFHA